MKIKHLQNLKLIPNREYCGKREKIVHFELFTPPEKQQARHCLVTHFINGDKIIHGETFTEVKQTNKKDTFINRQQQRQLEKLETEKLYKQPVTESKGLHGANIVKTVNGDDYAAYWDI